MTKFVFMLIKSVSKLTGLISFSLMLLIFQTGCTKKYDESRSSGEQTYTLYRSIEFTQGFRNDYAYFKTVGEAPDYNKKNCENVSEYLNSTQKYRSVPIKFWCEKGEFKE